jgi:hypothetical protein
VNSARNLGYVAIVSETTFIVRTACNLAIVIKSVWERTNSWVSIVVAQASCSGRHVLLRRCGNGNFGKSRSACFVFKKASAAPLSEKDYRLGLATVLDSE